MALIKLEALDWRYSASIVGLCKYFNHFDLGYNLTEDFLEFDEENIEKEKYLKFVEKYYKETMHHMSIRNLIEISYDDEKAEKERIKLVNEKLKGNTFLKKLFSGIKYDGSNGEEIKNTIDENRFEIIENNYVNAENMYKNFCNQNKLFTDNGKVCRVNGYYIDMGKKSKGNSYKFDSKTYVFTDSKYFDFIPFAFSKNRESFFINCNVSLDTLVRVNNVEYREDTKSSLRTNVLLNCESAADKIEYDVEIILKQRARDNNKNDFFETLYIRKDAIEIFKNIKDSTKETLQWVCFIDKKIHGSNPFSDTEYISIEKVVTNNILNITYLDNLIEFLIKVKGKEYLVSQLISINRLIYKEGKHMVSNHIFAQEDAIKIKQKLSSKGNKLRAYEQKLVSAISLKDYDKVKEILIHLSSYTQLPIRCLIPLCEDFEKNKNLAYTFINSLGEKGGNN